MRELLKNNAKGLLMQHQDDHTIILSAQGDFMTVLNQTSMVLLENCNGKSIDETIQILFEKCLDKETINYPEFKHDCEDAIQRMIKHNLIRVVSETQ